MLDTPTIDTTLKEAARPVPVRDTPYVRELQAEARAEGRQEGRQEGEHSAVVRLTAVMLHRRFGDDPRIHTVAARLADLPDEERLARLDSARALDDLT